MVTRTFGGAGDVWIHGDPDFWWGWRCVDTVTQTFGGDERYKGRGWQWNEEDGGGWGWVGWRVRMRMGMVSGLR